MAFLPSWTDNDLLAIGSGSRLFNNGENSSWPAEFTPKTSENDDSQRVPISEENLSEVIGLDGNYWSPPSVIDESVEARIRVGVGFKMDNFILVETDHSEGSQFSTANWTDNNFLHISPDIRLIRKCITLPAEFSPITSENEWTESQSYSELVSISEVNYSEAVELDGNYSSPSSELGESLDYDSESKNSVGSQLVNSGYIGNNKDVHPVHADLQSTRMPAGDIIEDVSQICAIIFETPKQADELDELTYENFKRNLVFNARTSELVGLLF